MNVKSITEAVIRWPPVITERVHVGVGLAPMGMKEMERMAVRISMNALE